MILSAGVSNLQGISIIFILQIANFMKAISVQSQWLSEEM